MEESYKDTLIRAREQANRQIHDPRERAIIIRHIEDTLCRAIAAADLPKLEAR
jgi:hypothetical protein